MTDAPTGAPDRHPPTIWMNVTTSERWDRPAVGIVRVERALREALLHHYGDARLRCVVMEDGQFRRVPQTGAPGAASPRPGDVLLDVGLDWVRWGADSTRHYARLRSTNGLRIVTVCYDLIPILYPQYTVPEAPQRFAEYLEALTRGSDAVLCISQRTRRDYLTYCRHRGLPAPTTTTFTLGDEVPDAAGEVSARIREIASSDYLLFVSSFERRKNHEVLYRAYHLLASAGHRAKLPRLVFVGMPGWGVRELANDIARDPRVRGLILHLDRTTDAELNLLYRNALFCVYPSLYEGWGLPVAEALAMGKLVVCSNRGSLPEVGGDLVPYLDPWNAQAWADTMLSLVTDRERLRGMEARIQADHRPRTWSQTAAAVAGVIDALGG